MKINAKTLDEATSAFLETLDDERKNELRNLIPSSRIEIPRKWMEKLISMFGLNESGQKLCDDIEQRFPNESVFKGPVFDNANGFFEAEILLREARKILLQGKNA